MMAFNRVYEVVGVTCQSRSWFVLYSPLKISYRLFGRKDDNIPQIQEYTPRSKYDIAFSGERMTIYRRYKSFFRTHLHIYRYIATDEANGNTNKRDVVPLLRDHHGSGGGDG